MKILLKLSVVLFCLSSSAGCGEQPAEMPSVDDIPHLDVVGEYTLQPGEEKYFCYTVRVPREMAQAVTRVAPTYGTGTHHILFSQAISREPEGKSECAVLSKTSWLPLYAGGKDSGPLSPPPGSAMRLVSVEQQLIMQLHLQNASPRPLTSKTVMRVEFARSMQGLTWAGLYGMDNRVLSLPARTQGVKTSMSCTPGRELNVFAIMGHMHKRGRRLQISRGAVTGSEMLFQEEWNFDQQPVTPIKMQIRKDDQLFLDCEHDNETDKPVLYGESSDTEMCAAVFYYTPFENLDGCINQ